MILSIFCFFIIQFYIPAQEAHDAREYFEYISFGYNAVEVTYDDGGGRTYFFMLNNPLYSNMRLWCWGNPNTRYELILIPMVDSLMEGYIEGGTCLHEWYDTDALKHYYERYQGGYTGPEGAGMLYETDRNGRMVSARHISRYRETVTPARSIRYNSDGSIIVDFGDFSIRFYNIPEQELVDRYLAAFTQTTREYLNLINDISLQGRTKEELAIIRNCLFAKYNYNFQSLKWRQFMLTYYDSNYQGNRTNQEVMDMLNRNERRLLERITYYENR